MLHLRLCRAKCTIRTLATVANAATDSTTSRHAASDCLNSNLSDSVFILNRRITTARLKRKPRRHRKIAAGRQRHQESPGSMPSLRPVAASRTAACQSRSTAGVSFMSIPLPNLRALIVHFACTNRALDRGAIKPERKAPAPSSLRLSKLYDIKPRHAPDGHSCIPLSTMARAIHSVWLYRARTCARPATRPFD